VISLMMAAGCSLNLRRIAKCPAKDWVPFLGPRLEKVCWFREKTGEVLNLKGQQTFFCGGPTSV